MKQMPSKTKHRKSQKGSLAGYAKSSGLLEFGDFGMQALDRGVISAAQMEACRVAINKALGRSGMVIFRVFPDLPVTQKPREVRMGSGKGSVEFYGRRVRPGDIIVEIGNVPEALARQALFLADSKLAIRTRFVTRKEKL